MNIYIHELTFSIPEMIKGDCRGYCETKNIYAPIMCKEGTTQYVLIPCFYIYPNGDAVPPRKENEGGMVENPTIPQLWKNISECINASIQDDGKYSGKAYDGKSDINLYLFRQSENRYAVGMMSSGDGTTYRRLTPSEFAEEKKRWSGQE